MALIGQKQVILYCPQRTYLVALYPEKSAGIYISNLKDALFSVKLQRFIVDGDGKEQEASP